MKYVMSLDEFDYLKNEVSKNKAVTAFQAITPSSGFIDTHDVKFSYTYADGALNYAVLQKHTLAARIASDNYIEEHVDNIIKEVLDTQTNVVPTETKVL